METIKDIVAEMRKATPIYRGSDVIGEYRNPYLIKLADRIEQAVTNCNQFKMREALKQAQRVLHCAIVSEILKGEDAHEALNVVTAALSAPPRNCDLYNTEVKAGEAFIVWYNTAYDLDDDELNEVSSCDLKHNIDGILHGYIKWLFAEAKG